MSTDRKRVKLHTIRNGRGSHYETNEDGIRTEITYALFDCKHCGEEAIATKADSELWDIVWPAVKIHLKREHPEIDLDN